MDIEVKEALETGLDGIGERITALSTEYHSELEKHGLVSTELTGKIDGLAEKYAEMRDELTDVAQKQVPNIGPAAIATAGSEFIDSEQFKALATGQVERARYEVKNTIVSDSTTVFPNQQPGVIGGDFAPVTIRQRIPTINVTSNAVNSLREASNTNAAAEVAEGGAKAESAVTFEQYNVTIETVAHWLKVSNQLLADAPAIAAYIDTRLRDGLSQRVDQQLLLGNGTTPNLSGLTDSGNFTAFSPAVDANLAESINTAKYAMWATGNMPDTVIVNPADWGTLELIRESSGSGTYLYGAPGTNAGTSPFGVQIVMSNNMPAGSFLIGDLGGATIIYQRQGAVVEMGFQNADFTNNLVTIRAEERLGLGIDKATAILYGDITGT